MIHLQNRGASPISFYQTSVINPGFAFQVLLQNQVVLSTRYENVSPYTLASKQSKIVLMALDNTWLNGDNLEIVFDKEWTGAHSIANRCDCQWHLPIGSF